MPKVEQWDIARCEQEMRKRLQNCMKHREKFDREMETNGAFVYDDISDSTFSNVSITFDNSMQLDSSEVDESDSDIGSNFVAKFVRFKLGQYAANPPSVIAKPTSPDRSDRKKADAADRVVRHGYRDIQAQEIFDQATLKTLVRGIGWMKLYWDEDEGDSIDFNEETGDLRMTGTHVGYSPSSFDVWVDPLAKVWKESRYTFERHVLPVDEAKFKFSEKVDLIDSSRTRIRGDEREDKATEEDVVEIFEYYEKALPINGMGGRHMFCLRSGVLLTTPEKNPHYQRQLPYFPITDIDIENEIYGKSHVSFATRKQEMVNRFDTAVVDAMQAHGCIRMAVSSQTELNDDEISNGNYDIVHYEGNIPPTFMNTPALPPDLARMRAQMVEDIRNDMDLTDMQMGIQKRQTSGFSQQTAIEAGNTTDRRFFNKYTQMVEWFWKTYLGLARDHWKLKRTILVLGKEKSFEATELSGAEIAGGYDLVVEHGQSLPIDPNMRREQIMLLIEPLEKAGMPMQKILKLLKLNELDAIYDELEQGDDRQSEIFEEMFATNQYIAPQELENHEAMLIYCTKFRMSMEYKTLPLEHREFVEQHIRERIEMGASVAAGEGAGGEAPPIPGEMPMEAQPAEMMPEMAAAPPMEEPIV